MIKYFITLILILGVSSCNDSFQKPHYRKRIIFDNRWERRRIIYFNSGSYRNPIIYKEAKSKLINPININLDEW